MKSFNIFTLAILNTTLKLLDTISFKLCMESKADILFWLVKFSWCVHQNQSAVTKIYRGDNFHNNYEASSNYKKKQKAISFFPKHRSKVQVDLQKKPNTTDRKRMCLLIFNNNINSCPTCYHFRDIPSRNVQDLDLYNGSRSNQNMLIESHYTTLYLMTIVMIAHLSPLQTYSQLIFRMENVKSKYINRQAISDLILDAIVMLAISCTADEMFTVEKCA